MKLSNTCTRVNVDSVSPRTMADLPFGTRKILYSGGKRVVWKVLICGRKYPSLDVRHHSIRNGEPCGFMQFCACQLLPTIPLFRLSWARSRVDKNRLG